MGGGVACWSTFQTSHAAIRSHEPMSKLPLLSTSCRFGLFAAGAAMAQKRPLGWLNSNKITRNQGSRRINLEAGESYKTLRVLLGFLLQFASPSSFVY